MITNNRAFFELWNVNLFSIMINKLAALHLSSKWTTHKTFNISRTLVCNKIVDHSDVVGALPVGAAPATSSHLT